MLEKRYENKKVVINYHVKNILFKLPSVSKESSSNLRKLLDTVQQHKSALEKLKLPLEQWDALVILIVLSKLHEQTNREWELKQSSKELPTLL